MGDRRSPSPPPPATDWGSILGGFVTLGVGAALTYATYSTARRLLSPGEEEAPHNHQQRGPSQRPGCSRREPAARAPTSTGSRAGSIGSARLAVPSNGRQPGPQKEKGRPVQQGPLRGPGPSIRNGRPELQDQREPVQSVQMTRGWNNWGWKFWDQVDRRNAEEIQSIADSTEVIVKRNYRHKYNKLDEMFQNVLRNIKIVDSHQQEFRAAFNEVVVGYLLPEMKAVDALFEFLYRAIAPAGSTWEDLRIGLPNEFDVNLVLFPLNVQSGVSVEDLNYGHIGIQVPGGFQVDQKQVSCKLSQDHSNTDSSFASISCKLKNWLDPNGYVKREAVTRWLQSVVDMALSSPVLKDKWTLTRSKGGPAITVTVTLDKRTGKKFSIDLVPTFEFSTTHLPSRVTKKIDERSIKDRTWYAIPKGLRSDTSLKMWRTSLYEYERDLMKGKQLLKPCIRIMKSLRDCQRWKELASYYIKTIFLWEMEHKDSLNFGLGQIMMLALKTLEQCLRDKNIKYYWDSNLNLFEDSTVDPAFFINVANQLQGIIKKLDESLENNLINPLHFFVDAKNSVT